MNFDCYGSGNKFARQKEMGLARCRVLRNDCRLSARFCLCRASPIALKNNRRAVQQQLKCNSAVELDQPRFLQNTRSDGHAGTTSSKHLGNEFLSQGKVVGTDTVLSHQQPFRQLLSHSVETTAYSNLFCLEGQHLSDPM